MIFKRSNFLSYNFIGFFSDTIYWKIKKYNTNDVLDAGCGTGELTYEVSKIAQHIDGVDFSSESIRLAREYCKNSNVVFYNSPIGNFRGQSLYSLCFLNHVIFFPDFTYFSMNFTYKKFL